MSSTNTIVSWVPGPNEVTGEDPSTLSLSGAATGPPIPLWKQAAILDYQNRIFGHPSPSMTIPGYPQILTPEISKCGPCKAQWVLVTAVEDDRFPTRYFGSSPPANWIFGQYFCPGLQIGSSYQHCVTPSPRQISKTVGGVTTTQDIYFGLAVPNTGFAYVWQNVDTTSPPGLPPPINFYYNNQVIWTIDAGSCTDHVVYLSPTHAGGDYFGADEGVHYVYQGVNTLIPNGTIPLTPAWSILPYTGPLILDPDGDVDPTFEIHAYGSPVIIARDGPPYYIPPGTTGPTQDNANQIRVSWEQIQSGGFHPENIFPVGPLGVGGEFASSNQPFANRWDAVFSSSGQAVYKPGIFFSVNIHPPTT